MYYKMSQKCVDRKVVNVLIELEASGSRKQSEVTQEWKVFSF